MKRENDGQRVRKHEIKVRATSSELMELRERAGVRRVSVAAYLRSVGLGRRMSRDVMQSLSLSEKIGRVESAMDQILIEAKTDQDSLLIWQKLCDLEARLEGLSKELVRSC